MKAVVAAFNQEKALVGAFSVILPTSPINRFAALLQMLLLTVRVARVPVGHPEVQHGVEQQAAVWGQEHGGQGSGCGYPHILSPSLVCIIYFVLSSLYYLFSVLSSVLSRGRC